MTSILSLLFEAGVAYELIRLQDYVSDSVVWCLVFHDSIKKIIEKESLDAGNVGVLLVTT